MVCKVNYAIKTNTDLNLNIATIGLINQFYRNSTKFCFVIIGSPKLNGKDTIAHIIVVYSCRHSEHKFVHTFTEGRFKGECHLKTATSFAHISMKFTCLKYLQVGLNLTVLNFF